MKLIVETTGAFMLIQTTTGAEVKHNRPTIILSDAWCHNQLGLNTLRVVAGDLPDSASDVEFAEYLKVCDGDAEFAVSSYMTKFQPPDAEK